MTTSLAEQQRMLKHVKRSLALHVFPRRLVLLIVVSSSCLVWLLSGIIVHNHPRVMNQQTLRIAAVSHISGQPEIDVMEFNSQLTAHASAEKVIILSLVDTSFLDMTLNFYETSILKFGIKNYLFIASDHDACDVLLARGASCYLYMISKSAKKTTIYGTREFNDKMNIRTFMILDALNLGFTVLHSDVDIIFFKNPLSDLASHTADMLCLWDIQVCNAGFVYIKPTKFTINVYENMTKLAINTELDDQKALKRVRKALTVDKPHQVIQPLDANTYLCGASYFEKGHRYYAGGTDCSGCIVVHNNWLVSKEAKRYRFQENLLWFYDDQEYYSSTKNKYLVYSNPPIPGKIDNDRITTELDALKTALYIGHVLNRDVILPRFHNGNSIATKIHSNGTDYSERPLNSWIKISTFDGEFHRKYRESTFLQHPKVPLAMTQNITEPFWIKTKSGIALIGEEPTGVIIQTPANDESVTTDELLKWFGDIEAPVLRLHSIYGIFGSNILPSGSETSGFRDKIQRAFKKSTYRQIT